jgi:hypothetical protein
VDVQFFTRVGNFKTKTAQDLFDLVNVLPIAVPAVVSPLQMKTVRADRSFVARCSSLNFNQLKYSQYGHGSGRPQLHRSRGDTLEEPDISVGGGSEHRARLTWPKGIASFSPSVGQCSRKNRPSFAFFRNGRAFDCPQVVRWTQPCSAQWSA